MSCGRARTLDHRIGSQAPYSISITQEGRTCIRVLNKTWHTTCIASIQRYTVYMYIYLHISTIEAVQQYAGVLPVYIDQHPEFCVCEICLPVPESFHLPILNWSHWNLRHNRNIIWYLFLFIYLFIQHLYRAS